MSPADTSPLVSVVILCWNRKQDIAESLSRLSTQGYDNLEIIVVDNGSTDGSPEMIRNEFPGVELIPLTDNLGVEAYNVGFRKAAGKYIVILDDDSFPAPHAIGRMVEQFEADPALGIVAFDVRNYHSYEDVARTESETRETGPAKGQYLMGFNGAGAGVRREVFRNAGYYPEEFFLYMNEKDLALRVLDAGYTIEFFPEVISYHKYSPKNRTSWRAPFYYTRNTFWVIWKNFPFWQMLRLTVRMIYLVFYNSFEQKTDVYLKALWDALRNRREAINRRRPIRPEIATQVRLPLEIPFTFYR